MRLTLARTEILVDFVDPRGAGDAVPEYNLLRKVRLRILLASKARFLTGFRWRDAWEVLGLMRMAINLHHRDALSHHKLKTVID